MYTAEWLFVLNEWRTKAFMARRPALLTSLWRASCELQYIHWCDMGMNPAHWRTGEGDMEWPSN